jgi:hypothetical protein
MAVNVSQIIAAGFELCEYHILDSNGVIAGTAGSIPAVGAIVGAGVVLGVQTANIAVPEPERVNIPGDDTSLGKFQFDSQDTPEFNLVVGAQDLQQEAAFQSMLVESDGDMNMGVLQPFSPTYKDLLLIFTSKTKSYAAASRGTSQYSGYIIAKVQAQPLGRVTFEGRAGAGFQYACIANQSTTWGVGATFQTAVQGTESAVLRPWSAENRISMDRATGNNVATTFTLNHKPASSAAAKCRIRVNGVQLLSGYTVNATTKVVTFSVAPANNAVVTFTYEWIPS